MYIKPFAFKGHAFRGIAPIIGQLIDDDTNLASHMQAVSAAGWMKEF